MPSGPSYVSFIVPLPVNGVHGLHEPLSGTAQATTTNNRSIRPSTPQNCLNYFGRTATYAQKIDVAAGVRATFIDAGHILGSASIFLELAEPSHATGVLFSGDLGSTTRVLLRSPAKPPHTENVVMETTYGDRLHKQLGPSIDEFYEAITETLSAAETSSSLPSLWSAHRSCSIT